MKISHVSAVMVETLFGMNTDVMNNGLGLHRESIYPCIRSPVRHFDADCWNLHCWILYQVRLESSGIEPAMIIKGLKKVTRQLSSVTLVAHDSCLMNNMALLMLHDVGNATRIKRRCQHIPAGY